MNQCWCKNYKTVESVVGQQQAPLALQEHIITPHRIPISSSTFLSSHCPALLTVYVVSATESRWFAILTDSRAETKPSPTAPTMGIKSC